MNDFKYSHDNKRYHTLAYHNKEQGITAYKAVVDAGFTCPNIDGTKAIGGCIYCDGGSGYFTAKPYISITEQLDAELARIRKKNANAMAIAYFQAHTNTYAPTQKLKEVYGQALAHEGVCGISIATRADCLDTDVVDYLQELSQNTNLTVELGLQTIHDQTAEKINRGHTYQEFLDGYRKLKERSIRVCVHIINGLPDETARMMIETARQVGLLCPDGIKIHLLHVIKDTKMAQLYENARYTTMSFEDYVDVVVKQLELLPPETVIERLTGDGDKRTLLAPLWSCNKIKILNTIDKAMAFRDTCQGAKYKR